MNKEIELQALITEREGMLVANIIRIDQGYAVAYNEAAFMNLAERIRALDNVEAQKKSL